MASLFAAGLTGGAAANNINVWVIDLGTAHLRYTDRKAGANAARALLSRRTTGIDVPTATTPYTVKTS